MKTTFAVDGSGDRIVLLYWATSEEARLNNVARIDQSGMVLWSAELPGDAERDCFVSLEQRGDVFVARTFAGHEACVDSEGRTIAAELAG